MHWRLITIGKPKLDYAARGIEEYLKRLRPTMRCEWEVLRAGDAEKETTRFLAASEGAWRVALDERGEMLGSRDFAKQMQRWELGPAKTVAFMIGGADGLPEAVAKAADWKWSLGPQTLQHELATVVVLEQLYRACQINHGSPYHRD